jgi:hypothetical protein
MVAVNVPPMVVPVDPDGVKTIRSPSPTYVGTLGTSEVLVPAALFDAVRVIGEPGTGVPEPGATPPATARTIDTATLQLVVKAP